MRHLLLAGGRIDRGDAAGQAVGSDIAAAVELALHVAGVVVGDVVAAFDARNVDEAGVPAVGGGPVIVAAGVARADVAGHLVVVDVRRLGVDLHVLARIVVDRPAGLGIDPLGPGHLGVGHRVDELAAVAVEHVVEAAAARMGDDLAVLAVHLGVDEDVGAGLVIVVVVVRRVLEMPDDLAGRRRRRRARLRCRGCRPAGTRRRSPAPGCRSPNR